MATYTLTGAQQVYALTGQDISYSVDWQISPVAGSLTLTGQASGLFKVVYTMDAPTGSYALTGVAATFDDAYQINADVSATVLTGIDTVLNTSEIVVASDLFYVTSGPAQFQVDWGLSLSQSVGMASALSSTDIKNLSDGLSLEVNVVGGGVWRRSTSDEVRLADDSVAAAAALLTDTIGSADTLQAARTATLLDSLGILPALSPNMFYRLSHSEQVALSDALVRFASATVSETVGMASTALPKLQAAGLASDTIGVAETLQRQLVLRLTASDEIGIDPTQALNLVYGLEVSEEFEIGAAYIAPGDNFTTWAVNPKIGAVTEYTNWQFNSFAEMGNKYLGASADGLYELNGDSDDGQDIIAQLKSGYLQLGGSRYTSFKAAYLGVHGGGDWYLKLETGDGKSYTYMVTANDMETTKINLGKGLRARYFSYELTSVGQDFDIDSVEFVPIVARRRV